MFFRVGAGVQVAFDRIRMKGQNRMATTTTTANTTTDWPTQKTLYQARLDRLNQTDVSRKIAELQAAITTYVSKGSCNGSTEESAMQTKLNDLIALRDSYAALYRDIQSNLKTAASASDLTALITDNGTLQTKIQGLEKTVASMKVDVESAVARDEILRTRDKAITSHDLFLLGRPVRRGMIPYLWALAILLIGLAMTLLYRHAQMLGWTDPMVQSGMTAAMYGYLYMVFGNRTLLWALIGALSLAVLVMSLRMAGTL